MTKKLTLAVVVILLSWVGIRLVFAERNDQPSYMMFAGKDYVQQEWNFCTRFDSDRRPGQPAKPNMRDGLNSSMFSISRPIFWLENRVFGKRIEKGDAHYDQFMKRVEQIRYKDWDYVVSGDKDGKGMVVIRKNAIVQRVD